VQHAVRALGDRGGVAPGGHPLTGSSTSDQAHAKGSFLIDGWNSPSHWSAPTQASSNYKARRPKASRHCRLVSWPITAWKSRTSIGRVGPATGAEDGLWGFSRWSPNRDGFSLVASLMVAVPGCHSLAPGSRSAHADKRLRAWRRECPLGAPC